MKRKISIRYIERRQRYVVDFRNEAGKRHRTFFKSADEAEDFKNAVSVARDTSFSRSSFHFAKRSAPRPLASEAMTLGRRVSIKDAIKKYSSIAIAKRPDSWRVEKGFLEDLYIWFSNYAQLSWIDEVELLHLEGFQAQLIGQGLIGKKKLKASSVNRMFNCYRTLFKKCVTWNLIAKSPMDGLKALDAIEPEIRPWCPGQIRSAQEDMKPWLRDVLVFLAETGRRPVDAKRLLWSHVNFDDCRIQVTTLKGLKSRIQYFPMSDTLVQHLKALREKNGEAAEDVSKKNVFLNAKGNPIDVSLMSQAIRRWRNRTGFPRLTLYGIRHWYIDGLIDLGAHPRDVQLLAGHRKFDTTARYTHRKVEHLRSIANQSSQTLRSPLSQESGHSLGTPLSNGTKTLSAESPKPKLNV